MPVDAFRRLLIAAALVCMASPSSALDPRRETSQYVITRWGSSVLPSNTIHALLQTRDRRLWLGTASGLVRFDGADFALYTSATTPSFEDGGVARLAEGTDGALYVGTTSGNVLRYTGGEFVTTEMRPGSSSVSALMAAADGSLWIGVWGHDTTRLQQGQRINFPELRGMRAPLAIVEDGHGVVWIGTRRHGLMRLENGVFTRHEVTPDQIQALSLEPTGALWIGTPHGLLRLNPDGHLDRFTAKDGLTNPNVSALLRDRDGNLWVGTAGGLNRLRDGRWSRLTTLEGLSDDDVRCLLEDHEGNLWIGTADGLTSLSDGRFVTYGRFEGLPDPAVSGVTAAAGGGVWLGLESGRVARLKDGGVREFHLPSGVGPEAVRALHETRDGSLWIAQDNGRLFRLKDGAASEHTPVGAAPDFKVVSIGEDERGGPVFFVAALGPARVVDRHFVPLLGDTPRKAYLRYPHAAVRDEARDTTWICDLYGLVRLRGTESKVFGTNEGMPHARVRWASLDDDGGVWAATAGGLAYVKGDRVQAVTTHQGLPENHLRVVLDDGHGYLWLASMGRIFRLDKRELHDLFAGTIERVAPVVFDTSDGLRTTEGLPSNSPGFRAADGRLWFATAKGVSVIDPAVMAVQEAAPAVSIERLTVDAQALTRDGAEFPPGRGETRIEYTSLSYRAAGKIHFRHRLEGFDHSWVDGGTGRRVTYSSLPAGHYRFSVMASNRDGAWNGAATTLAFTTLPPFYQTRWFYTACVALVLGLAAAAHRLRVNQMRTRFAMVVHERTRIARELHDTLAQGLAGVKLHADTALSTMKDSPDVARRSIQCARSIAVSSLSEVRRSIWVLRAQAAKGEAGLGSSFSTSLRQLTADTDLQPTITVEGQPRGVPVEVERNLLRIAHEAVTNAIRHSGASTLTVDLRFTTDAVHLRVHDDGRGFDPEAYLHGPRGEHFGLLGMRERVHSVRGDLQVRSRPAAGTEIVCRLPYEGPVDPLAGEGASGIGAEG
jgi:signal transduction histidine kinase/streptogramin lyase